MSKLGSLYITLGEPEGDLGGCCEIADWAADEIKRLRAQNAELLQALEELADQYQYLCKYDGAYDEAMAVIAKARGEK